MAQALIFIATPVFFPLLMLVPLRLVIMAAFSLAVWVVFILLLAT